MFKIAFLTDFYIFTHHNGTELDLKPVMTKIIYRFNTRKLNQ